eukprot:scaffold9649_cov62-Phaeocystis_antarctica.AAC.1
MVRVRVRVRVRDRVLTRAHLRHHELLQQPALQRVAAGAREACGDHRGLIGHRQALQLGHLLLAQADLVRAGHGGQ